MIILINCCVAVFLSSITGTILLGFWRLCRKRLSDINPLYVYSFLKIVCLGHLVPVAYVAVCVRWNIDRYVSGSREMTFPLGYTSSMGIAMLIFSVIWGILTVLLIRERVIKVLKDLKTVRLFSDVVEDQRYLAVYQRIKEQLGITKEIPLLQNNYIKSPFVSDISYPVVIICGKEYSESDLEYIFMHELTHLKSRDLIWKKIVLWISALQSFNPFCKYLSQEIERWSEIHCDIQACREGDLNVVFYYGCIYEQIKDRAVEKKGVRDQYLSSMLFENKNCDDVTERIFYMKKYQKRWKKRTLLAAISIAVLSLSGVLVSYAAGQEITETYQKVCEDTLVMQKEMALGQKIGFQTDESDEFEDDGLEEYILMPGEYDAADWVEGDTITTYSNVKYFNWGVPANSRMESGIFYKSKNDTITVTAESIDGKELYIGIWEPSGIIRYVTTSTYIRHVFSLNSSGFHKVIVHNPNNTVAEVAGYYY